MTKKLVHGVGEYATGKYVSRVDGNITKAYRLWVNMLTRCYSAKSHARCPTYIGCTVSDEFKNFQGFMLWAEKQAGFGLDGFQLDKDLLVEGNKIYSADTCVFIPRRVNCLLIASGAIRGGCPVGVSRHKENYQAQYKIGASQLAYIGIYSTPEAAFKAYKVHKEAFIKSVAVEYKDQIDPRAYAALMDYEISITD